MPVWNDKTTRQQAESGQVSVNSAFTWSLLHLNAYQFCSSNVWVLQDHSVHALDMNIIIAFVYLRLQYKSNQLSSNNSRQTSCIHKGLHAGKWPDLVTSKPHALSTLRYHWTDCTGTTLADAIAQLSSSGNPVLICIIRTNWKATGIPLQEHWKQTGYQQFLLQWHSSVHRGLSSGHIGLPLDCHWIITGSG